VTAKGFVVREMVEGLSFEELQNHTGARLTLTNDWRPLTAPESG
jgi:acyl CoA:acetate/3-ketoacid CoA transferase beta subunit